jgi:hypothetical protein
MLRRRYRQALLGLLRRFPAVTAGRLFEELRSVNGKETRTMSPRL